RWRHGDPGRARAGAARADGAHPRGPLAAAQGQDPGPDQPAGSRLSPAEARRARLFVRDPRAVRVAGPYFHPSQMTERGISMSAIELDIRVVPPSEKHPTIFRTFDSLEPGQAFTLINDHDPR